MDGKQANAINTLLKDGAPQIIETWRIAFQNDPGIPDYSIRVMRDGTEAEIVGGLKYGLADDFVKILGASRHVKIVHLDSTGGRLGEGEKLYEIIRSRGLTTYVSSKCMSACTLAFAGGRERYLRELNAGKNRWKGPGRPLLLRVALLRYPGAVRGDT